MSIDKKAERDRALREIMIENPDILLDINRTLVQTITEGEKGSLQAAQLFLELNGLKPGKEEQTVDTTDVNSSSEARRKRLEELGVNVEGDSDENNR